MKKILMAVLICMFLTACGEPDENLRSLSCGYSGVGDYPNSSASFTIGGFDIRGMNTVLISLQKILMKNNGATLYDYSLSGDLLLSGYDVFGNYDKDFGSKYTMNGHFMNLAGEFETILESNDENEYLKLCPEYVVYVPSTAVGVRGMFWVSNNERLGAVKGAMTDEYDVEENKLYILKRSWAIIDGAESVEGTIDGLKEEAEDLKTQLDNEELTEDEKTQLEEELKETEGKLDSSDYVNGGITGETSTDDYDFVTDAFVQTGSGNYFGFDYGDLFGGETGVCSDYLGLATEEGKPAYYLDFVYNAIKILTILFTIVLSMMDLVSTVSSGREINEISKKIMYRIVILICILMLPTLIEMVGNLLGKENLLCGIGWISL